MLSWKGLCAATSAASERPLGHPNIPRNEEAGLGREPKERVLVSVRPSVFPNVHLSLEAEGTVDVPVNC